MSITKLKTVGSWYAAQRQDRAAVRGSEDIRGRVITGMLSGGEPASEELTAEEPRCERAR
jgi:hypothetical protein